MALPKIVQDINNRVSFAEAQTLTDAQKAQARANIGSAENNVAPIGSYIYFAGSSVPTHYLLCNGAAVSRTTYSALFAVIGTKYGGGNGSTTFNLPNLIDKFLEGSSTSGTEKSAGLPNITGSFIVKKTSWNTWAVYGNSGAFAQGSESTAVDSLTRASDTFPEGVTTFDASLSSAIYGGSTTVQPPALTALPCIRYE